MLARLSLQLRPLWMQCSFTLRRLIDREWFPSKKARAQTYKGKLGVLSIQKTVVVHIQMWTNEYSTWGTGLVDEENSAHFFVGKKVYNAQQSVYHTDEMVTYKPVYRLGFRGKEGMNAIYSHLDFHSPRGTIPRILGGKSSYTLPLIIARFIHSSVAMMPN